MLSQLLMLNLNKTLKIKKPPVDQVVLFFMKY